MSLLNTFFLRYRADTGQATRDVNNLADAEEREAKIRADAAADRARDSRALNDSIRTTSDEAGRLGDSLGRLGAGGAGSIDALRGASQSLMAAFRAIGPAGLVATLGIGTVIAAVSAANDKIKDARVAAKEAIVLGENAFEARLAQGELIRLQGAGRVRGIGDEDVNKSAQGTYARGAEIRAAQRQAARDPASAFNNPLIKQARLWRKAGVDIAAGLETQISQQDKYIRSLVDAGKSEQALVEGTQLFGRSLADVKSVMTTTQKQMDAAILSMAIESKIRRQLQTEAENLATSEAQLEAARKNSDERIRLKTVPATNEFTKALTEWERSITPLRDAWGQFVSSVIEGMAKLLRVATRLGRALGIAEDVRSQDEKIADGVKAAGDDAYINFRVRPGSTRAEEDAERAKARKDAEDAARIRLTAEAGVENKNRQAGASEQTKLAVKELIGEDGTFDGKQVSADKLAAAIRATEEAIKADPALDTLEEIKIILSEQLAKVEEQGKVQDAQTALTKKIEANTLAMINTGLEQAMALWAANVGKGAGIASGALQGETQIDYEKRVRGMQRRINPNVSRKMSMDRAAIGAMSSQADQINRSGAQAGGKVDQSKTVTIGTLKVEVVSQQTDVSGLAQDVAVSIRDELRFAAAEFASPVVS